MAVYESLDGTYDLIPITVSPEQLCLDPHNLRFLLSESETREFTPDSIPNPEIQDRIYRKYEL